MFSKPLLTCLGHLANFRVYRDHQGKNHLTILPFQIRGFPPVLNLQAIVTFMMLEAVLQNILKAGNREETVK